MSRYSFVGTILFFVCCMFCAGTYASEEAGTAHKLEQLRLPDVPLDNNPFRREVFSLKELQEDRNEHLLDRIIQTRMDFPLMFSHYSAFASSLFPDPYRARFGRNFSISIWIDSSSWPDESVTILRSLKAELAAQGLDLGRNDKEIGIELMVFMKNFGVLRDYVETYPGVNDEGRKEVLDTLEQVHGVCEQLLEFKALTLNGIKNLDQIDNPHEDSNDGQKELPFERFVAESKDMKPDDIDSILEIRNPAQFRSLCLDRTAELMADADRENVEELLAGIGPSDAIVLAAYFARDRIRAYQKPTDQMVGLSQGETEEFSVGDCRYFAGLAVHYLNLVIKPANPNLEHWYFGIERENVSDYHHVYVKAVHVYEEDGRQQIDLFFFDPVVLSSKSMGKLDKKDIRNLIDAASKNDHFFSIQRYGEDFVAEKYRPESISEDVPGRQ